MKKLLFALCFLSMNAFGQSKKLFFSFSPGFTVGGPSLSIRHQMIRQGFNHRASYDFFGWSGTTEYPRKNKFASLLFRAGYKVSEGKSIYFVGGLSAKATITGFRNEGYTDLWIFGGGSAGPLPEISYEVYQLSAGYMYSQKNRAKYGLGPSLYFLNYSTNSENSQLTIVPGIAFTGRFPLGKEKRVFGTELILESNIAPPVKIKPGPKMNETGFRPGKVNMISLNIGLGFTIRP